MKGLRNATMVKQSLTYLRRASQQFSLFRKASSARLKIIIIVRTYNFLNVLKLVASSSGLYEEKKNLCIANFWFALTLKKDSFKHDFLGAKVTDCFDDERITFSK